jgi:hypothetical protein
VVVFSSSPPSYCMSLGFGTDDFTLSDLIGLRVTESCIDRGLKMQNRLFFSEGRMEQFNLFIQRVTGPFNPNLEPAPDVTVKQRQFQVGRCSY